MRLLALIGALAIIVVVGAAIFFFGGFYNVAATEEDPGIVNWALAKVRAASVTRHAGVTPAVNLDDEPFLHTNKIHDIRRNRILARELESTEFTGPQTPPELSYENATGFWLRPLFRR